jgi:hypothetical protein
MLRRYGYTSKWATGRKLFNGMIRNNWKVCEYSERDIAKFEAPLGIKPLGSRSGEPAVHRNGRELPTGCHSDRVTATC